MALNPQQQAFKDAYINPMSATFGNAYRSALEAGYTDEYANVITTQGTEWFSEILRDKELIDLAEKGLKDALEYDKEDKDFAPLKLKAVMFTAETLGKQKYSKRIETDITTGGKAINTLETIPPEALAEMRKIYEDAMKKKLTKGE